MENTQSSFGERPEYESVRQKYHITEANVKSFGLFTLMAAALCFVLAASRAYSDTPEGLIKPPSVAEFTLWGIFSFITGIGLIRLSTWARIPAIVFSCFALVHFPMGTLFGALMLYAILNPKAAMVFSGEYKQIIANTPQVRHRTSAFCYMLLFLFIVFFIWVVVHGFSS